MAKRGRPITKGPVLTRDTYAPYSYDEARRAGEKHDEAVRQAASYVRKMIPGIACSETEVRRALAIHRPTGSEHCITVTKNEPSWDVLNWFPGVKTVLTAWSGPRPILPRHNAADKTSRKKNINPCTPEV